MSNKWDAESFDNDEKSHCNPERELKRGKNTTEGPEETTESLDTVFGMLADTHQRYTLYSLLHHGQATLDELATRVTLAKSCSGEGLIPDETVTRIRAALYHTTLPKLAEAGFVDFDRETRVVTLTENATTFEYQIKHARQLEVNENLDWLDSRPVDVTENDWE